MRFALTVFLCLFLPSLAAADSDVALGERKFQLHLPPRYAAGQHLPMVIAFHGGGGNPKQFSESTGLNATADANGFIIVYPYGTGPLKEKALTWNAGGCCGQAAQKQVDDVRFTSELIDYMEYKYGIDPKRVYATGHSNGAMMSYRLACELPGRIAAIAPVAAQRVTENCHPARAVPILHIHGTADRCALYDGGEQCGGCYQNFVGLPGRRRPGKPDPYWRCESVPAMIGEIVREYSCWQRPLLAMKAGAAECYLYSGCSNGAEIKFCKIQDGGHSWPNSKEGAFCKREKGRLCKRWREQVGIPNKDLQTNEVIWDFLKRYSL